MATSANTKTVWLLLLGIAVIAFLILPIRLTPVVPLSIDTLPIEARAQLVQRYEKPAQDLRIRVDTLRLEIRREYGGTTPGQDSTLNELTRRVDEMLRLTSHLRDPRQATFEERQLDIGKELERLNSEANQIVRQLVDDYLR